MMDRIVLLLALLAGHYLADYCLTLPIMIRAKTDGRNLWPIALHAGIHATLVAVVLIVWGTTLERIVILLGTELITHFLIDLSKAKLSFRYPLLADMCQKPYWMVYGLDQLLHQIVIIFIWIYA